MSIKGIIAGKEEKEKKAEKKTGEMSFLEHLEELRWHLVRSSVAVVVGAVFIFINVKFIMDNIMMKPRLPDFITNRVFAWFADLLNSPDLRINTKPFELINYDVAGQFTTHLTISMVGGIIIAIPYIFYEFWSFIKPALYDKERKHATGAVFYSSLLFVLGVMFGYFLVVPLTTHFFGSYTISDEIKNEFNITSYISSLTTVVLGGGIIFELPIIIYFLSKVGIISASFLRKYRRHAYIILLLLAAIITPPDVFSMMLVTMPLVLLYELGIFLAKNIEKKKKNVELLEA